MTRGQMIVILMNVGQPGDIREPLTPTKREELRDRYKDSGRLWPPMEVDYASPRIMAWVDDAVTRGVLFRE